MIQKKSNPQSEEELRNLSKTDFLSKTYESFILDWLFPFVEPHLDPNQFGGLKGSSITHHLVRLLHFIHMALDNNVNAPKSVVLALLDIGKAYNRSSHRAIIEDLHSMHAPGWVLAILISYLKDRRMYVKFNEAFSQLKNLPSGLPQGCYLSVILFIILINGAFLSPSIPRPLTLATTGKPNVPTPQTSTFLAQKFIDDCGAAAVFDLKSVLIPEDRNLPRPSHSASVVDTDSSKTVITCRKN